MPYRIFVINPGSSSLKTALYEDGKELFSVTKRRSPEELSKFPSVNAQLDFHYQAILDVIEEKKLDFKTVDAIAARGGLCKPLKSGTYTINDELIDDLKNARFGEHVTNLSPICAKRLSEKYGVPAYFTNPVSVDEFMPISYITGIPGVKRTSMFHALNHKAAAGYAAEKLGKKYEEVNLIVAHMGGGISIAAHQKGLVVDATTPSNDGPMSIDRPGSLPNLSLVDLCYEGSYSHEEMVRMLSGKCGIFAYCGMTDLIKIEEKALTDETLALALDAMAYRIAFWICGFAATLSGDIDAIVLTGGMARSDWVVPKVMERIKFLAPVIVIRGEFEMQALAEGAVRVLSGVETAKEY
jgi:butyrate kinase